MFLLNSTEQLLILAFVVTTMLSVGMHSHVSDFRALLGQRALLARTLVANFVVVPFVGVFLALLLPVQPHVAGALVLLACTPGGVSAIQFTTQVKGDETLAGGIVFLLSLLAVFLSPLLLWLVLGRVGVSIPYGGSLLALLLYMVVPLLVGMLVLAKAPGAAAKLAKLLALLGIVAFIAFMVVTGSKRQAAVGEIGWAAAGGMLLFIAVSMAVGWFLGGPAHGSRQILATATSMRNAALCLAIVESTLPDHAVLVPLVAFSLLMVPTNMLFTIYNTVQAKRRARKGA
jgi:BASS family bile acid:Na+ symporter